MNISVHNYQVYTKNGYSEAYAMHKVACSIHSSKMLQINGDTTKRIVQNF